MCVQDRDAVRKQNATVQEPHNSHFKLTQQALMQSAGRILNPLEITQVGAAEACRDTWCAGTATCGRCYSLVLQLQGVCLRSTPRQHAAPAAGLQGS